MEVSLAIQNEPVSSLLVDKHEVIGCRADCGGEMRDAAAEEGVEGVEGSAGREVGLGEPELEEDGRRGHNFIEILIGM